MSDRAGIKPNVGDEVKSVAVDDRTWWKPPPMTPQHNDLSGDLTSEQLATLVARADHLPLRRQAAALLLLELAHGDLDVEVSDDVNDLLAPVRMSLR